jgi:imidazolonepropionase
MSADLLIYNARLVTCAGKEKNAPKRGAAMREVGLIEDGAVAVGAGKISAVGHSRELCEIYADADVKMDAGGRALCPGLVDAHTHVVYAGDRVDEFEQRLQGATYQEIMAAGGGILNTVTKTRAASVDQLVAEALPRLAAMLELGTTTAEVKTGYGLDTATELKMLHAIEQLAQSQPIELVPTFLGAHSLPPEYKSRPDDYVNLVINEMLPQVADWYTGSYFTGHKIPLFIDVFCEKGVFDTDQTRRILEAGAAHGLALKAHVDEFVPLGGTSLGVELGAVSLDHLDYTSPEEIRRVAASDTVALVIPAVNFNLGSTHFAPARTLLDSGAALALATDINPGSAPCPSLPFVMALACRYQHLLPAEVLNACTLNAAYAIGLGDRLGAIEVGKDADFVMLHGTDYRELAYSFGGNPVRHVFKKGRQVR